MQKINNFTGKADNGKTVKMFQHSNGIYHAEIRNQHGQIESAVTNNTPTKIHQWIHERINLITWD